MNRIYRLVWNRALRVLQVASEFTRGRTKGGRNATGGRHRAAWLAAVPLSLPLFALAATPSNAVAPTTATVTATAVAANALPTGGQVTNGSGRLAQHGDTLTVTQQSQNLSLNWQTFNIGSQSTVDFVQPDASAIAVNRIADTNGSQIFGHLNANGQVFLINPNGVLFGQGAQVNVGGLVASTLDVNDSALGTGSLSFSGNGKGRVTNLGTINVTGGGYAALLGNQVSNQGTIHAQLGSVALAGGNAVTLNFDGDKLVSVSVDQSALDALAQNGQLIEADGGNVWMTAGARDSLLASAVNNTGTIEAQTVQNQNGHIMLIAGMDAGAVSVNGTLDASAPGGGNGGQIETSAANVNVANTAKITTAAQMGLSGTWLIDPTDFTIAPSGGDISGATLSTELSTGNVVIQSTAGSKSGSGNVNVDDIVSWSAHTLTLDALNNININATMTASGTAGLALNYGGTNGSSSATPAANTSVDVGLGGSGFAGQVNFTGGNALSINGNSYTLIGTAAALQGITTSGLGGRYALADNLTLSGNFTPIGNGTPFTGVFDGLGHTISGLTITNSTAGDVGLFGASTGTIRNVALLGGSVSATSEGADIGGLVGDNSGTISNVFTTGTVSGLGPVGIDGGEWIGGLVGKNETGATVSNAYATGAVSGATYSSDIGGLVGTNYGSIRNAYATGPVSGSYGGTTFPASDFIGGLVGYNPGTIANAYARGNVSWTSGGAGNGNSIGGLVGSDGGSITDAYSTGHVSSGDSSDQLGGLVGNATGDTITASYWDTTTSGQSSGAGVGSTTTTGFTGLSTAQMMQPANFSWVIATSGGSSAPWRLYTGNTTPLIESLLIPLTINASSQTVTYNGTNQDAAVLSSSSLAAPNLSAITGLGLTSEQHAGSYTETLSSSAYSTNYDLSFGTLSATLTIDPATLTPILTNSGVTKIYNGTTAAPVGFTPTYTYSGLISGDVSASLTDTSAAYNSAHVASATDVTVSGLSISSITGSNGSLASDYTLASTSASVAATITPATLTATLTNSGATKVYNGTTAAPVGFTPTYSYSGLISGDTGASLIDSSVAYNSAHVASATDITVSGLALGGITGSNGSLASDYSLASSSANVAATITPATLTLTLSNSGVTKTYDGTTNAPTGFTPTYSYSGLVSGDTGASLSDSSVAYNSAHVASATDVTVSGLSISGITGSNGSLASDYSLATSSANVAATITPALLTISLSNVADVTKIYDGTTAAPSGFSPTYSFAGLVAGDSATVSSSDTPVFNSPHVVSATAIMQGGLSLTSITGNGSDNSVLGDYTLSSTTAATGAGIASITPATLTATLTNSGVTKTYDGTTNAPTGFTPTYSYSGLISGDTNASLSDTSVAYNSAHVASATDVTASGLSVSGITGSNGSLASDYTLASSSANVAASITPAPLTISLSNVTDVSKIYDGNTAAPSGFSPTYSLAGLVAGDSATVSSSDTPVFNSSHVVSATVITQGGLSLTSIAGNGTDNSVLGDYTLSSTTASTGNGVASISPIVLSATAPTIGGTTTKVYDGTTFATGATLNGGSVSGALSGDTLLLDTSGITLDYNSSHVMTASSIGASGSLGVDIVSSTNGSQSTDYSVALPAITTVAASIIPATLTLTLSNSGVTKTYDGTTAAPTGFTPTYSYTGLVSGDTGADVTDTGVTYNSAHVVSATDVTVSGLNISGITGSNGSLASDYSLAISSASVSATITPAILTLTLTNSGVTKTYDGTTAAPTGFTPTYSYSGLVSGDTAAVTDTNAAYNSADVANASNVTVSGLNISGITGSNGSLISDYSLASSSANVVASITPAALTASLTGTISKVYDGSTTATLTPGDYTLSGFVSGQGATVTQTSGIYNNSNVVGATTVTATLASGDFSADSGTSLSNYTLPTTASGAASITPALLLVTANNAGKTYNGAAYSGGNGVTYSGFVNGEGTSVLGGTLTYGGNSQGAINAGFYTITPAGLSSSNYTINFDNGVLTVSPATLTASLIGTTSKVYDGTTAATLTSGNYTLTGVIGGDAVSLNDPTSGIYATANAGSGINVQVSGLVISGSGASNYLLSNSTATAPIGTITPAPLTITANNASLIYNAQAYSGVNGVTYNGFVDGQTAAVLGGALTYGGSSQGALNVGSYTLTPGGLASGNYAITYDSGTLTMSPATLTYVAMPVQMYAGQSIPPLTGTVTGFQGSDTLAGATTGTLAFTTPATTQNMAGEYAVNGGGLAANDGDYVFVQAAGNAQALTVLLQSEAALPGVAFAQQQLGKLAPDATVPPSGGLLASNATLPSTATTQDEEITATPRSSIAAGGSDLYTPDVRVIGGGVRLP